MSGAAGPEGRAIEGVSLAWREALRPHGGAALPGTVVTLLSRTLAAVFLPPPEAAGAATGGTDRVAEAAQRIAEALVEARLIGDGVVGAAVRVVHRAAGVLQASGLCEVDDVPALVLDLQAGIASAYDARHQAVLLAQQEAIHQAATTAWRQAQARLNAADRRFRALFDSAAIGIGLGDLQGRILDCNPALQRMLGYSVEEFRRLGIQEFVHVDDAASIWEGYAQLMAGKIDFFRTEKRYLHRDGHTIWTNLTLSLVRGPDGRPAYHVAMMEDITERHALQERMRHAARHDSLTGLPNRDEFMERLEAALGEPDDGAARRVAVCFVDLDGFKMVNDTWGHLVGDAVLQQVAQRLDTAARSLHGMLARLSGDEFVYLLDDVPADIEPAALGEVLLASLAEPVTLPVDGEEFTMGASAGVVVREVGQYASGSDLLRAADLALHAAKEEGRGRVVVDDPDRTARQITRFGIAMSLTGVLERGELALVYQPLLRLDGGGLHSMEALLRWAHPRMGDLSPELFVAVAEESPAAITSIGAWVLGEACGELTRHPWPSISVNVSARQLYSASIVADVRRCLADSGLRPEQLKLEITESILVRDQPVDALRALGRLADLGVRLVIDDFGTGYANWASLRSWPLHELKIAAPFVDRLGREEPDPVDVKLFRSLVDLAHAMHLVVTAEGVETLTQHERVLAAGCDVGQGWFYSAPAAPDGQAVRSEG